MKKIIFYLFRITGLNELAEKLLRRQVFIIGYHSVGADYPKLSMEPGLFEKQMQYLNQQGHTFVHFRDLSTLPPDTRKPTVVYFDDGYKDNITTALPILQRYGVRATFFVTTSWIDQDGAYMNWDDVRTLHASGMEIGSHTVNHLKLNTMQDEKKIQEELVQSKKKIEQEIGERVTVFSYPKGGVNKMVADIVKAAGYDCAVTTKYGTNSRSYLHRFPYILRKVAPRVYENFDDFTVRLYGANLFFNLK